MSDSIEIQVVTEVDSEVLEALRSLVPQLSSSAQVPSTEEVTEIVRSPCTTLLFARDRLGGRKVIGSLTLATFRIPTGVRAWIEDVVVDGTARGKGVGEALSREAIRIAIERGARTVELSSRPSREAANRLYRRIGFQIRETNVYRYSPGGTG